MAPKKLTARSVDAERRIGHHADAAVTGLYLQVTRGVAGPARSFKFRFTSPVTRRRRDLGLGCTSDKSLSQARAEAMECRNQLLAGKDPLDERQRVMAALRLAGARAITFDQAAAQCIAAKSPEWRNAKHVAQWTATLATYASPTIGLLPVNAIDNGMILRALEPIWASKTETATRVRQRIETVLDWCTARGYRTGPNPAALKGNLAQLLPRASRTKKVAHHPALPFVEINAFIKALRTKAGISALALEFLILTAARTGEVIGATWEEIDLDFGTWTIPASRMKARREHRVPLNIRAMAIVKSLADSRTSAYVFPGHAVGKTLSLSGSAMLEMMRDMPEYKAFVPHGFRSTFRDWAAERTSHPNETIELALAHTIRNQTEAAYRRGDQLDRRRKLMEAWNAYTQTAPHHTVTQLRSARI